MIIVKTPLRISFAGGGSDIPQFYKIYGGATLSTAINKYVYIVLNEHFDKNSIRLSYSKTEIVPNVESLEHTRVKAGLKLFGIDSGVEIATISDIPSHGTGLGSSSSFMVGFLKALHAYKGQEASESQLAEEACKIEIEVLKEPIGKQDQFIASFGGLRFIEYLPNGEVKINNVQVKPELLKELEESLLLFYTGLQRSANKVLQGQVEGFSIKENIDSLKKMTEYARLLKSDLENGRLDDFGKVLHESWLLKKSLAKGISHNVIDDMYQAARDAGALGGKILGAGGGGFLMVLAPKDRHDKIRQALSNFREMPVKFSDAGSKILTSE